MLVLLTSKDSQFSVDAGLQRNILAHSGEKLLHFQEKRTFEKQRICLSTPNLTACKLLPFLFQ